MRYRVNAPSEYDWNKYETKHWKYWPELIIWAWLIPIWPWKAKKVENVIEDTTKILKKNIWWWRWADEFIAEQIAEKVTKKFGNFECKECAIALWDELKKVWVDYEKVLIKTKSKWWHYSEKFWEISTNSDHIWIKVWDIVFDNLNKVWMKTKDWLDDLWYFNDKNMFNLSDNLK